MDYHHPYNVYPEYYNSPQYNPTSAGYPPNPAFMHHHPHGASHPRNYMPYHPSTMTTHIQQQQFPHHQHSHSSVPSSYQHPKNAYFNENRSNQRHSTPSSAGFMPNFLVSSGTGLTPTLTPTTLATIEQSFLDMQQPPSARDPVTQSGFVPPVVEPAHSNTSADHSQDSFANSSSDGEWEPGAKKQILKQGIKGVDYIVTSTGTVNVTPQRKYTRRNKDETLPPEEEERRRVRRERNKVAAAKCRQRRVDHTNELLEETEELIAVQNKLESEIQSLKQEKDQLEFILQTHKPLCKVNKTVIVKTEPDEQRRKLSPAPQATHLNNNHSIRIVRTSPVPSSTNSQNSKPESATSTITVTSTPATTSSIATARPNSLPLIKRERARMMSMTSASATGVSINTPTSGVSITPSMMFCPDLGTMADGSTGLTPITGMSCSSQVNNRSNNESSSNTNTNESVETPNLISL